MMKKAVAPRRRVMFMAWWKYSGVANYGLISTGVPTETIFHTSSISSLLNAMQPAVQSKTCCVLPTHAKVGGNP